MKNASNALDQSQGALRPGSFISLKDYLVGEQVSTNPYASIDNFLDETWNIDVDLQSPRQVNPSSPK